jgi:hypothetical protein
MYTQNLFLAMYQVVLNDFSPANPPYK